MRRNFGIFAGVLALLGGAAGGCLRAAPADSSESIDVGGVARTYTLHVPAGLARRAPLILAYHGHGGTGRGQARLSGFDALADKDGFIVAYPDGINRGWDDGRLNAANTSDDLDFTGALIDELERRYSIDPKRIYATGMSNGATFTNYLGCNQANRIAAIAPVSGSMPVNDASRCHPQRAVSVLEIGGTADPIMPYQGGAISIAPRRGTVLPVGQTISFWANNAGCAAKPAIESLPPIAPADGTSITRTTYSGCRAGSSVVLYTVVGGGHTWPSGIQYLPKAFIGPTSRQLNASQVIVDFFLAHPMP